MSLHRILSFLRKRLWYLVLFPFLFIYVHMQRHSPTHPDPATGHVLPVIAPRSRRMPRHTMYLTSSERTLYHASFIVIAVGTFGILGHLAMRRRS